MDSLATPPGVDLDLGSCLNCGSDAPAIPANKSDSQENLPIDGAVDSRLTGRRPIGVELIKGCIIEFRINGFKTANVPEHGRHCERWWGIR